MSAERIRQLRRQERHEEARALAVALAATSPTDAEILYEAACVHDFLGFEADAVPFYAGAIAAGLTGDSLRGAFLGLGSTYRALGRFEEALATLDQGRAAFPSAVEIVVFRAMTLYNLGRAKEAVAELLTVVADTADDEAIRRYRRAITLYAEDLDRTWSS